MVKQSLVGREPALERLSAFAAPESGQRWLHVFGIGGVGKSALLRHWTDGLSRRGAQVVTLDGEFIPPNPDAVLRALDGRPVDVLVVDSFEKVQVLQRWMAHRLLERLSPSTRVVTAGRQPLALDLEADLELGRLVAQLPLGGLPEAAARKLLDRLGVARERRDEAQRLAAGHPLVLCLTARLLESNPRLKLDLGHHPAAMRFLIATLLDDAPTGAHRRALEVLAMHRATTEGTLRQLLGPEQATGLFDWLCDQSFTHLTPRGLVPHAVARRVLLEEASWRDPQGLVERLFEAHRACVDRLAKAAEGDPAELMNFVSIGQLRLRGAASLDTRADCYADGLRDRDEAVIVDLVGRHFGPQNAAIARFWVERAPENVIVGRGDDGELVAYMQVVEREHLDERGLELDPAAVLFDELIRSRAADDQRCVLSRFCLTRQAPMAFGNPGYDFVSGEQLGQLGFYRRSVIAASIDESAFWEGAPQINVHLTFREFELDSRRFSLTFEDFRECTIGDVLRSFIRMEGGPKALIAATPAVDEAFGEAVREALRSLHRSDHLADCDLCKSRLGASATHGAELATDRAAALRALLGEAVAELGDGDADAHHRRLLLTTYFSAPRKHRAIADELAMGYSTFRRHLGDAVDRLVSLLWERECALAAAAD